MKRTRFGELDDLLGALGVARSDKVCVHAFVPSLGVVEGGLAGIQEVLRRRIGDEGTLIVPAFTASYRRGEVYDVERSKSFNGAFSEHVRTGPSAVRSLCPLFSMAAEGPEAERLMQRHGKACFGHGSVYETLFASAVKYISFGVDWDQGYSFFMHLERLAGIPARRDEVFHGITRLPGGEEVRDEAIHFVRSDAPAWRRDRARLGRELVAQGAIREVRSNGCFHRLFESQRLADAVLPRLQEDPWCMTDLAGREICA